MTNRTEHYITNTGNCSACAAAVWTEYDDPETLDFHAEISGIEPGTPNGPPVHWAEGTIACPSCGMRLWTQVAS